MHDGPLQSIDREARVVGAVLRDIFFEAAVNYCHLRCEAERRREVLGIYRSVKSYERMLEAYLALVSK